MTTQPVTATARRRKTQSGNNLMEFALFSLFLMPLFMGTVSTGIALGKAIQTAQIARDAGHMFVRQVDFSQNANKQLIERIAVGMNMTVNGGNGNVVLSQVLMIGNSECTAAGLSGTSCTNRDYPVIVERILIGNPSVYTSSIGNPVSNIIQPNGKINPSDYLTNTSCRASTLSNGGPNPSVGLLTLQPSERTYIAEAYFRVPELAFVNEGAPMALYARNYF